MALKHPMNNLSRSQRNNGKNGNEKLEILTEGLRVAKVTVTQKCSRN